jgi:D-3-phosphoglycerate dehydrogenase
MTAIFFSTSTFNLDHVTGRAELERAGVELRTNPYRRKLTEDEAVEQLSDGVVGLVAGLEPLTARVLGSAPSLRAIARVGIGLDSVDLAAAERLGIEVMNTPDPPARAVAELTLGHILSLLRRISLVDRRLHAGTWSPEMGSLLSGRTVGFVGFGRIGRRLARLLEPFDVEILVNDPAAGDVPHERTSLDDLLSRSNVITLHVPYGPDTHHLIDANRLALMRPDAILVNVARGGLIDEDALADALGHEGIAGAALDCFADEPYHGPLAGMDRVQMTAHMGTYARETRDQMEREAATKIVECLRRIGAI